jgi:hypothetical protein
MVVGQRPDRTSVLAGALIVSVLAVHSTLALRAESRFVQTAAESGA